MKRTSIDPGENALNLIYPLDNVQAWTWRGSLKSLVEVLAPAFNHWEGTGSWGLWINDHSNTLDWILVWWHFGEGGNSYIWIEASV